MIIDAHQHFWTADYAWLADEALTPIRRDFSIADLRPHLAAAGVDRTVLVEAARCDYDETRSFLALAASTPEIAGVVGWASLCAADLADRLADFSAGPGGDLLVGIRDQAQGQPDDFLDRPDVRAGLAAVASAGLVNELVVRETQLPSAARAAASLDSVVVLDHLGKPRIAAGREGLDEWRSLVTPVAECPNVIAKLSGLVAEADWETWTIDDLRPFVETALELFGPDRLMYGSDWPVCQLAATYEQVMDAMTAILSGRPQQIFADTAITTYQLEIR